MKLLWPSAKAYQEQFQFKSFTCRFAFRQRFGPANRWELSATSRLLGAIPFSSLLQVHLKHLLLNLCVTAVVLGQGPTLEERVMELERRVGELERKLSAQAPAPASPPMAADVAKIYEAKGEAEAQAAAKKYVLGLWSSKGYETSGNGFQWMKWNFLPDGTMTFDSAFSKEGPNPKWATEKRKWTIATGRIRATRQLVYLIELEPKPSGSIIIQRGGALEWSTGEFECTFQRGDIFKTP